MDNIILLLTSCVNPKQMIKTSLVNNDERLRQYVEALEFYLNCTNFNIVFVDNSGVDIKKYLLNNVGADRVESLFFEGNCYPKYLGKGYGEMEIFEYAFKKSKFINSDTVIVKITGRLKLININELSRIVLKNKRRDNFISADFMRDFKCANSRVFISNKFFFINFLLKKKNEINDSVGCYFEHALGASIHDSIIGNYQFVQFPVYTRFQGVSGTLNKSYNSGLLYFYFKSIWCLIKYLFSKYKFKY